RAGPGGLDPALDEAFACHRLAAGRGAGARGVAAAGPRGRADHAGAVCARDRGRRHAVSRGMAGVRRRVADGGGGRAGRAGRVHGITAEELMDCWEASGSAYDAGTLAGLWASVPPEMRLPRLSADAV